MQMNPIALAFLIVTAGLVLSASRKAATVALLVSVCYMTLTQVVTIGSVGFSVIRLLVVAGAIRVIVRAEWSDIRFNGMDILMTLWGVWNILSGIFHESLGATIIYRLGLVGDACGVYFLLRMLCSSVEEFRFVVRALSVILLPVAIEMVFEQITRSNLFAVFGGVPAVPTVREGNTRAQGPFAHAILAGTVGAISLPLMLAMWKTERRFSIMGVIACGLMIIASASSGPILSAAAGVFALLLWRQRFKIRTYRWLAVLGYLLLGAVMSSPPYYIMARIDLAGGSTGWYRARLIQSSIWHLDEWWFAGTDYTRHWMPTGVPWSPNHTDITNQFIKMGVLGGLPLMVLYIAVIVAGFVFVGRIMRTGQLLSLEEQFLVWALGSALFSVVVTGISVSFFDQSGLFVYLILATIGSVTPSKTGTDESMSKLPAMD